MPNCFCGTSGPSDSDIPEVKYVGCRNTKGDLFEVVVERAGKRPYHLDPRLDIVNHSPTGVAWGYGGSGPAQLALAILADYLADDKRAQLLYQDFKWDVVQRLPMDEGFELTDRQVENAVTKITVEQMKRAQ